MEVNLASRVGRTPEDQYAEVEKKHFITGRAPEGLPLSLGNLPAVKDHFEFLYRILQFWAPGLVP